jgi:PAS domain S-box-containing protein
MSDQPPTSWTGGSADLREVLQSAADAITVQGADGRLVYANDAAARQVGFSTAAEFLAAPIADVLARYELVDESGAPFPLDQLPGRRALQRQPGAEVVVGFRVDGLPETRWSLVQATPVIRDGAVAFVINVFHDISELKRTEARLRMLADAGAILAASADYQAALQDLAEMVVPTVADWCVVDILEASGVRRVAVAHPDPAMRARAEEVQDRYPPDPTRPGGVADVMRTREPQIVPEITDEMLASAARDQDHLELLRGLGLRSAAILPLLARDQVLGAITLARTARSAPYQPEDRPFLEDLARRAAVALDNSRLLHDAQEAVRLRDDFLAMASHDMRTPLGAILGNLQLAQRKLGRAAGEPDEALIRNIENAVRTTGKLARLVDELMDLTLLRAGQDLQLALEEVDIVALAGEVAAEHMRRSDQHVMRLEGEATLRGVWDRSRVERVLDNLVGNAVKYSPDGGAVVIDVRRGDGTAVIRVSDDGIGIPAGELSDVFRAYHRATNTTGMRGIGLGLAGAREVVRQLGGDLTAASVEGQGSTFTLRLPLG